MPPFPDYRTDGPGWTDNERRISALMLEEAEAMLASVRERRAGYFLSYFGQTETGKTMLARLILRAVRRLRTDSDLIFWPDHTWDQAECVKDHAFLVIDDIGRGTRDPALSLSRLFNLIDHRQQRRLHTVITSNSLFSELMLADPALASRLRRHHGRAVQTGKSTRPFLDRTEPAAGI